MSTSKIEWTERTWNPVTGCNKVSQGCKNCYAEVMHKRLQAMSPKKYSRPFLDGAFFHKEDLTLPMEWKKPSVIFVNSMSDLFHENISFIEINAVFSIMSDADHHIYQVLTKRPKRMLEFFEWKKSAFGIPWRPKDNVWIGVSCEDQATANERIPLLTQIPAAVRFLSCEPLLGPIDFTKLIIGGAGDFHDSDKLQTMYSLIDWVIAGGESGHGARYMHPDWVRDIRDQCESMAIPFFFKQWGEFLPLEEAGQPPFWFFSNDGKWIDGHTINQLDPETGEAGKYNGYRFDDPMNAIAFCGEHEAAQCSFLRMGKKNAGNFLDGKQHKQFPNAKTLEMNEKKFL